MGKCKNCGNETKNNNVYCSYRCRNIYVNKNLRDYSKNAESLNKKKYYNPKKCKFCEKLIPYENRNNEFCNSSCSASYNNKFREGLKYNMSDEGLKNLRESFIKNLKPFYKQGRKEYYSNIKRCKQCNKMLPFNKRTNVFCDINCKNEYYKNKHEYQFYRSQTNFKFNLKDYPDEFDFFLIEQHGWYSPTNKNNNLDGVSRDHIYSVNEGFRNNIDPEIISHPANCRLMIHNENISKNNKCDITIDELKEKIKESDEKYG